jgi:hypothetical protein
MLLSYDEEVTIDTHSTMEESQMHRKKPVSKDSKLLILCVSDRILEKAKAQRQKIHQWWSRGWIWGLITKFQHEGILWGMEIVLGPVCASGPKNLCMGKKHIKLSQA